MCQIQCCMMGNLKQNLLFSFNAWTLHHRGPEGQMLLTILCVRIAYVWVGEGLTWNLLRLVNPSAHSSTRLKNNLVTSTHLSWSFLSLERKRRLNGGSSLEGREQFLLWCAVLVPSASSFTPSSTEFFLHNSHWANPRIVKVNKTDPHCQRIGDPVFASPPHP